MSMSCRTRTGFSGGSRHAGHYVGQRTAGILYYGQWELLDLAKMDFPLGVGALPIWKKPAQMYISGASVVQVLPILKRPGSCING